MQEQIFISYRRDGGDVTAKLICEALKNHGYTVFYDYDSIREGFFDDRILDAIEACDTFILVLSEHALDRCVNEDDWVRKEITHALKHKKNIVTVMFPGFTFPESMPANFKNIPRIQAVQFVMSYFDSMIETLIDRITVKPIGKGVVRENAPSLIRNVCSFGSRDFNNTSPSDAYYSEVIDRSKYNVIYFVISTAKMKDKPSIKVRFTIYNSENQIAYDDTSQYLWAPDYNQITLSWVVRGSDGAFVKAGNYKAVFRIEDSAEYKYDFTVAADQNGVIKAKNSEVEAAPISKNAKRAKRWLACPKAFVFSLAVIVSFFTFIMGFATDSTVLGFVSLIICAITWAYLIKSTYKKVTDSLILTLLITTFGLMYYIIFLAVVTVLNIFLAWKWKKTIAENK